MPPLSPVLEIVEGLTRRREKTQNTHQRTIFNTTETEIETSKIIVEQGNL